MGHHTGLLVAQDESHEVERETEPSTAGNGRVAWKSALQVPDSQGEAGTSLRGAEFFA